MFQLAPSTDGYARHSIVGLVCTLDPTRPPRLKLLKPDDFRRWSSGIYALRDERQPPL